VTSRSRLARTGLILGSVLFLSCGPPDQSSLQTDVGARSLTLYATYNRQVAEEGSWHLLVFRDSENGANAFFRTLVSPERFHQALLDLGGKPGDNMTADNMSSPTAATAGSKLEMTVSWEGSPKTYRLDQILDEPTDLAGGGPRGVDLRFGGNRTHPVGENPSDTTGCLACLYSCPSGVASNAAANDSLHQKDGFWRYRANSALLPSDGTRVKIGLSLRD